MGMGLAERILRSGNVTVEVNWVLDDGNPPPLSTTQTPVAAVPKEYRKTK